MNGWIFAAVFATATGLLAFFIAQQRDLMEAMRESSDREIALLRAERDRMLATALEAKGQMLIDPAVPRPIAATKPSTLRSIPSRLRALEEEDRRKAAERDARRAEEAERARAVTEQVGH